MLEVAALLAAVSFTALVVLLAVPLRKLGRTLDEATMSIRAAREEETPRPQPTGPATLLDGPLIQVEPLARAIEDVPAVNTIMSTPLIKAAAFTYGVRATVAQRLDSHPKARR